MADVTLEQGTQVLVLPQGDTDQRGQPISMEVGEVRKLHTVFFAQIIAQGGKIEAVYPLEVEAEQKMSGVIGYQTETRVFVVVTKS